MQKYLHNIGLIFILFSSSVAWGSTSENKQSMSSTQQKNLYNSNKFVIGIGVGIVKFDTNIKVRNTDTSDLPLYVDLEGTLDLPDVSHITNFYGAYRFNKKHMLMFNYFGINRSSSLKIVDEQFEDVFIVDANINVNDESRFYNLTYGYSLFYDDRSQVILVVGLNGMDLKLSASAAGEIVVDGETKASEKLVAVDVFAPLPLIGLNFDFSFTPKWNLSSSVSLVMGSFGDISGSAFQTEIYARYKVSKHIGVLMGVSYFSAAVDVEDNAETAEVSYGYDGASIGMHFAF